MDFGESSHRRDGYRRLGKVQGHAGSENYGQDGEWET